jgi:hypothetical protein
MAWYSTYFQIKSVNGATTKTFKADASVGTSISVGEGNIIQNEREKLDYSTSNYIVGVKQIVQAEFRCLGTKYVLGASGYDSLEAVLNNIGAGSTIYYSIDNTAPSIPCHITSIKREKLEGKNVGIKLKIELESDSVVSNAWRAS